MADILDSVCWPVLKPAALHAELWDLLSKYDVKAAAAGVKVFAIKPKAAAPKTTFAPRCTPGCCS